MRVGYIVKSQGMDLGDTVYFKTIADLPLSDDQDRDLVHDACEYAWDHNDGWEWLHDGETITLVIDNIDRGDYPVDVDSEPVFYVRKRKEEQSK